MEIWRCFVLADVFRADDAFFAQLGDGTTTARLTPVAVIGLNSGFMLGAGQVRMFVIAIWLDVFMSAVVLYFYYYFVVLGCVELSMLKRRNGLHCDARSWFLK